MPNLPVLPKGEGTCGRPWKQKAGDRAGDGQGTAEATKPTTISESDGGGGEEGFAWKFAAVLKGRVGTAAA